MNPTFQFCPPMEPSYSTSSDDSLYSSFPSDLYYSSSPTGGIEIPRSQPSLDPFDDFSPANSYSLQTIPDLNYPFNNIQPAYTATPIPIPSPSPFDTTTAASSPFQWPMSWDDIDISLPEYMSGSDQPLTAPKQQSKPYTCTSCGKAFTRSADLKRHKSSVHFPIKQDCPVEGCLRKDDNGFPRRDHLIEHLRQYHHWDVPKRRGSKRVAIPTIARENN